MAIFLVQQSKKPLWGALGRSKSLLKALLSTAIASHRHICRDSWVVTKITVFNKLLSQNPWQRYNPFSYIRSEKDILKLVTALIENTKGDGNSGDEFWTKAEKLLYQALIGYIYYEAPPHEQNMNSLVEMINKMEVREDNEEFVRPDRAYLEAV